MQFSPSHAARVALGAFVAALLVTGVAAPRIAAAQDAKFGKQIWLDKVNCRDCHGWGGHGVGDNPQAPTGANLRKTQLTADDLAEVIRCGRPGTEMPYFDRNSYTDGRCYGLTATELGKLKPAPGIATLIKREVDALVALITEDFVGKDAPTFEECKAFWGPTATLCDRYPKK